MASKRKIEVRKLPDGEPCWFLDGKPLGRELVVILRTEPMVAAASMSRAQDGRGAQPAEEPSVTTGSDIDEAERARVHAEYVRLRIEHDALEARLAALETEAAERRRLRPPKLGLWEGLGLYGISLALAALWSWRFGRRP